MNVLDDARPVAVLASAELAQNIPTHVTAFVLDGDDWVARVERCVRQAQAAGKPTSARRPSQPDDLAMVTYSAGMRPSPDNLAYVVYSSGTTGHPKGIQCPHRGAVHSYWWRYVNMPFEEGERVACNVFFVWEVLRAPLQVRAAPAQRAWGPVCSRLLPPSPPGLPLLRHSRRRHLRPAGPGPLPARARDHPRALHTVAAEVRAASQRPRAALVHTASHPPPTSQHGVGRRP